MTQTKALKPVDALRADVAKLEPQFKMALPSHIPPEKFVRVVQTAINNTPALANANRQSLFSAAMRAAQDGLLPDGKESAFVTFGQGEKATVQYMPMIQGILKKMRNSGEIASITAKVVYENDFFDYWIDETGEHLKHKPKLSGELGEVTHSYAIGRTKDGGAYMAVLSREEIEKIRSVSRSKDSGPWKQWWDQMAVKSALRRLSKIMPMSTDLEGTLHADDEIFNPPETGDAAVDQAPPPKKSSRLKDAMAQAEPKDVTPSSSSTDHAPEDETPMPFMGDNEVPL